MNMKLIKIKNERVGYHETVEQWCPFMRGNSLEAADSISLHGITLETFNQWKSLHVPTHLKCFVGHREEFSQMNDFYSSSILSVESWTQTPMTKPSLMDSQADEWKPTAKRNLLSARCFKHWIWVERKSLNFEPPFHIGHDSLKSSELFEDIL